MPQTTTTPARVVASPRGRRMFDQYGCRDCHQGESFTTPQTYDAGFTDLLGRTQFNPPSLRGVSQLGRLLHDNRAADLRSLLADFQHGLDGRLPSQALEDLVIYLESL